MKRFNRNVYHNLLTKFKSASGRDEDWEVYKKANLLGFLPSLNTNLKECQVREAEADFYIENFKIDECKVKLAFKIFNELNKLVFEGQLPYIPIEVNKRWTTLAG